MIKHFTAGRRRAAARYHCCAQKKTLSNARSRSLDANRLLDRHRISSFNRDAFETIPVSEAAKNGLERAMLRTCPEPDVGQPDVANERLVECGCP
jgi:hypothetical protein